MGASVLPLLSIGQLAQMVDGKVLGNAELTINGARPLAEAGAHDVTFVADDKHQKDLIKTHAAAILAKPGFSHNGATIIEVAQPFLAFLKTFEYFHPATAAPRAMIDARAFVHPTASLGEECYIGPFVSVGADSILGKDCCLHAGVTVGQNCQLGDECTLYPHAVMYDGCKLGHRVILHAHVVIGADGFGYRIEQGRHIKIPQLGGVEIEDDVEIGAGTTIDRGTFEPTRIGQGTKIDNLVQIGHNCKIGKHNMIVSQVGIGGSSTTGDYVVIAGQVGVADHVNIGDQAVLGAKAGVPSDIPAKMKVLGAPARPEREAKVILLSLDKIPEMRQDLRKIKQHLGMTG